MRRRKKKKILTIFKLLVLLGLAGVPIFVFGVNLCNADSDCPTNQYCRGAEGSKACVYQSPGTAVSVTISGLKEESVVPPRGAGAEPPAPAEVVFKGMAYPNALLIISKQNQVAAAFLADGKGYFEKKLTGLIEGAYVFGIFAQDSESRESITLNFTLNTFWGARTTVSNIFIPPTISLSRTQISKGALLDIKGEVFPESEVNLLIFPGPVTKTAKADSSGKWFYGLDTGELREGTYQVKAKGFLATSQQSEFSQSLSFMVGAPLLLPPEEIPELPIYLKTDLNFDGKVNLIDFSILLYWWNGVLPGRTSADINTDSVVDIVDFSIMMYYWTG